MDFILEAMLVLLCSYGLPKSTQFQGSGECHLPAVLAIFFSPCCDEMPGKRQLKDSWLWPIDHGYSPSWWGRHGRQYEAAGHSVHSCEAQGWQPCSADLLLIHGMVPYPEWVFRLQLNFSGITFTEVCLPADSTSWYTSWYIHCQPPHTRHYLEFNDHSLVCLFL